MAPNTIRCSDYPEYCVATLGSLVESTTVPLRVCMAMAIRDQARRLSRQHLTNKYREFKHNLSITMMIFTHERFLRERVGMAKQSALPMSSMAGLRARFIYRYVRFHILCIAYWDLLSYNADMDRRVTYWGTRTLIYLYKETKRPGLGTD